MSEKPEFAELVKTALLSDLYWQVPYEDLSAEGRPFISVDDFRRFSEQRRLAKDGKTASHIGRIVHSLDDSATVEPVPWGEPIPELHSRQAVMAVEDCRLIMGKLSPEHVMARALEARMLRKIRREIDPSYQSPSFEEQIDRIYDLGSGNAEALVDYNRFRVAYIRRAVFFMRKAQSSDVFSAMYYHQAMSPQAWEKPFLGTIPDVAVGEIYSKDVLGGLDHLGRIVSAHVVEVSAITWKDGGSSSGGGNKDKRSEEAENASLPKLSPGRQLPTIGSSLT